MYLKNLNKMKKINILASFLLLTLLVFSCANENKEETDDQEDLSFMEQAKMDAEAASRESKERYINMTPEQFEVFFRNSRGGIVEAIASSKKRISEYEATIADFTAKKKEVTEKDNLVATNKLRGEKDRLKRLEARLVNFDNKIKDFSQIEPNERPEFIEELKVIMKN